MTDETELRRLLSANIKRYRGLRNWSQVKLAEKIDISVNFLADIETGKSWISSQTLAKLANIFEIEAWELFKSDKGANDEVKTLMRQFVRDFSVTLEQSLDAFSRNFLE
jgi:transcriptional regulator with XRE-family HTH domain